MTEPFDPTKLPSAGNKLPPKPPASSGLPPKPQSVGAFPKAPGLPTAKPLASPPPTVPPKQFPAPQTPQVPQVVVPTQIQVPPTVQAPPVIQPEQQAPYQQQPQQAHPYQPEQQFPQQQYDAQVYPQQGQQPNGQDPYGQYGEPQQQQPYAPSWEDRQRERAMQQQQQYDANAYGGDEGGLTGRSQATQELRRKEEPEDAEPPTGKKGRKAKPVKEKRGKKKEPAKENGPYAGSRRKLLWAQISFYGIICVLVLLGAFSLFPKASYLTENDENSILIKVRENLGETYFPTEAGEGWAAGFLDVYLNYDAETSEKRKELLLTYTTEPVYKEIEVSFLNSTDLKEITGVDEPTNEQIYAASGINNSKKQTVTAGPYLIKKELIPGGSTGIFSYKAQINGNNWAYIEVPVYYDMNKRALSVSGTPTFRSIIPIAQSPYTNIEPSFESDKDVEKKISGDIENYFKAWVASDQKQIDRYLVKKSGENDVTPQASVGLGGSAKFLSMRDLKVQLKEKPKPEESNAETEADYNKRYVYASIRVVEPTSGIVYPQNYQLTIQYVNDNWFIQDVRNVASIPENTPKVESEN